MICDLIVSFNNKDSWPGKKQETGDGKQETGDGKQETGDGRREKIGLEFFLILNT